MSLVKQFNLRTDWDLDAGVTCLDFANTADWHASAEPVEELGSYADLVAWGWASKLLSAPEAERLLVEAQQRPANAKRALTNAIALREAIYRTFAGLAAGQQPVETDLERINRELSSAMARAHLTPAGAGFEWGWDDLGAEADLNRVLWPVVRSAADLLTSDELDRVGQCADNRGCGWLFYDTSRNRSRRWCSMESCGNRAKALRHYEREKVGAPG